MNRTLRILLLLTFLLGIVQIVLPHDHDQVPAGQYTFSAASCTCNQPWYWAFTLDIGDHHLEEYTTSDGSNDLAALMFTGFTIRDTFELVDRIELGNVSVARNLTDLHFGQRGPPRV